MREGFSALLIYLQLQAKRMARVFPSALLVSALFFGAVLLFGRSFFLSDDRREARNTIRIGVVGSFDDPFLQLAVTALKNLDSSRFTADLTVLTENEAASLLRRGELQAYVVIPEGFYESVDSYRNDVQITYVSTSGAVGIGTVMMNEIAEVISRLLTESENAVYGMQVYAGSASAGSLTPEEISELGYALTGRYGAAILRRDGMYEVTETGLSDALSFRGYYLCALLVLLLLFLSVPFGSLYTSRDRSLTRLLRLRGISCFAQAAAEYLVYCAAVLLLCLLFLPLCGLLIGAGGFQIPELSHAAAGALPPDTGAALRMLSLVPPLVPAVLVICSASFLLYELFTGALPGILIQIFAALFFAYLAGCFYPVSYFPEKMRLAADLLPAGTARLILGAGLKGHIEPLPVLRALLTSCALVAAAARVRAGRR